MKETYLNNIETYKEVLNTLPKNNEKNLKAYKEKVNEILSLYTEDISKLKEEIDRRIKHYLSVIPDVSINLIDAEISEISSLLPIINRHNSSYEKSNLDKILYKLGHYYTIDLSAVNTNIFDAINAFSSVGINLTPEDFTYSYYTKLYLEKLLSLDTNNSNYLEEFKNFFESIYWKCPDIINHITLNFKYLYYKYQKKFDTFYETLLTDLNKRDLRKEYLELLIKKEQLTNDSKYITLHRFLDNELNINDYTQDKISKSINQLIDNENYQIQDITNLYHTLYEYNEYLSLDYIITDIKKLYDEKAQYKNIYSKKKKEIIKKEKHLFNENRKILKSIAKGNNKKIDYHNNIINSEITILKNLYEELEVNYFKEKLATFSDSQTVLDILYLAASNYNYLIELTKKNSLDIEIELSKINNLIYYPYINLINNIWIKDEKDIPLIIMDKYNLYGLKINKEMLEQESLSSLINTTNTIINGHIMQNHNINESIIKFIKEGQTIQDNN